jgi:hypothetical protein
MPQWVIDLVTHLDSLAAIVTVLAVVWFLGVRPLLDYLPRRRESSTVLHHRAADYGNTSAARPATQSEFRRSPQELELGSEPEPAPVAPAGTVVITEKALQARLSAAMEAGRIEAYAKLYGAGYLAGPIAEHRVKAMKELIFETGRRINSANPEIEKIAAQHRPPVTESEPRAVKVYEGRPDEREVMI